MVYKSCETFSVQTFLKDPYFLSNPKLFQNYSKEYWESFCFLFFHLLRLVLGWSVFKWVFKSFYHNAIATAFPCPGTHHRNLAKSSTLCDRLLTDNLFFLCVFLGVIRKKKHNSNSTSFNSLCLNISNFH